MLAYQDARVLPGEADGGTEIEWARMSGFLVVCQLMSAAC